MNQKRDFSVNPMTKEEFVNTTGYEPENDDLDRINCSQAGDIGHTQCGWCEFCKTPRFRCRNFGRH